MKTAFMMFTGIVTTMLGVGGVENSITNTELLQGLAVSLVGLGIMYSTVLMIRREENK
jgi:uncharacterized membrane protein